MRNRACLLLVMLTSITILEGCARDRAVTQKNAETPHHDRLQPDKTEVAAGLMPAKSDQSESSTADASNIRLVNDDGDLSDPSSLTNDSKAHSETTAASAGTQIPVPIPSSMSLKDLEDIALQNNPTLIQAQAEIEVDLGYLKQAGLYPNPQGGYYNESASNPSVRQANGMFLSQEFVTANKLTLAQQSILQEIKQMQWDQQAQQMRVLNDLKIRYFEVLGAQQSVELAVKLVTLAEETVVLSERNLAGMNATRSDVLQARVQLETARLSLNDAQYRYSAAWEQLAVIIAMPSLQPVPLTGDLAAEIPELDPETCLQTLLANSPQLAGSASQLDHGWAEYRSQRARAIPNVTVQGVLYYDQATQTTTASSLVTMPIPYNDRNQGNVDKAAADIRLFQAEIKRVELVLREQLAISFQTYKSSRRKVEVLKQSILPNAEENLKLTREIYAAGESNFNSVLAAQQTYFQSQIAYVDALTELNKVVTEIKGLQLTGGLNPPAIGSAIQATPGGGQQRQRALLKDMQDRAQKQLLPAASQIAQ